MKKTIDPKEQKGPDKSKKDKSHGSEYQKKYEKGHFPRKVWPTDSEKNKDKGPKI